MTMHAVNAFCASRVFVPTAVGSCSQCSLSSSTMMSTVTMKSRGAHLAGLQRRRGGGGGGGGRCASLRVQASPEWWESAPLPPRAKQAAKEIQYFQGSPLQQFLPWMSAPKATPPGRTDSSDPNASLTLFDFTDNSPDSDPDRFARVWGELNDVVMGGKSEGAATIVTISTEDGGKCAKLSGVVQGEGGGFVSMRTRNFVTPLDLEEYDGLKMRVRGDGRRYKLILRDTEDFFALSYHTIFDTTEGEWIDVEFPFDDFTPVLRGDAVKRGESADYRDFRKNRLYSLQVMMSKYELGTGELNPTFASGPISLEISSVKAYKRERAAVVKRVLQSAAGNEESAADIIADSSSSSSSSE